VLFIQGVGVHGDGWLPQVEALAPRYRCLTFDNRGIGQSQPVGDPVTVEQMAEDARVLMDAQGWPSAHVVGHSLGGLVALHLALSARERVRSLSLLCTFANGRKVAPLTPRMIWLGLRTQIGTRRMRRNAFLRLILPASALAGEDRDALAVRMATLFGHDLGEQPPIVPTQLKAMRASDATPRLGELAGLPTLVASAVHDPIAPPKLGRAIAAGVLGARYVDFADASHGLPITHAEKVNALLAEHFSQTPT
jgi:pimeloyl-ACP methyl ester carboxylesterase